TEHNRNGGKHLHMHSMCIAFVHPHIAIPAVVFYFAEKFIALHHAGTARLVMFEPDEISVTKLSRPVGHFFGNDMRVNINFHEGKVRGIKNFWQQLGMLTNITRKKTSTTLWR